MINDEHWSQLFASASLMIRAFGDLLQKVNPTALEDLDSLMVAGAMIRLSFSVGAAGPLCLMFHAVQPDGKIVEVFTIDAPPSDVPFLFGVLPASL